MTKVVHLIDNLRIGGAEKQLALFARYIDHNRFSQTIVCMREKGPLEEQLADAGITVVSVGKKHKIDPLFFLRLVKVLRELNPDILHCWLFSANLWGRLACFLLSDIKVIATERVEGEWKRWYHRVIDKILFSLRTDILLANSRGVISYCFEKEGLTLEKIRLVFNAIDVRTRERVKHHSSGNKKIVITMSRLTDQKGIDSFIKAARLVADKYSNVEFRIYGEGEKKREYQDMVAREGLTDMVLFKEKDRVHHIMQDADAYLSASRFEGLPNAIMEAMAYGLPVIATNIGGTNELIAHGQTGLLAEKDDCTGLAACVTKILNDDTYADELGSAARAHVNKHFLITDVVKEVEHVYAEVIGEKDPHQNSVLWANKVVQKKEAEMFELIHPELFKGIEQRLLLRDIEMIQQRCGVSGCAACDVGAGTGRITRCFIDKGYTVTAVELSEEMAQLLERNVGSTSSLHVKNEDVHNFLLQNKQPFDIISFSAVLHHCIDYPNIIHHAAQQVKPEGVLFITHEPILRRRAPKKWLSFCIDKVDSIIFRLWLAMCKRKRLPVTDYSASDPFGIEGIDEEAIRESLEREQFDVILFERYSPRKTRIMSVLDQAVFRTGHQFRIIAQKHKA
ncbi:MAG: glycosyltransferase [Candidatus Omnitrophica bacterium]|nr:glycosyltransferase [Candidatus Omnitrophota bacterium]